MNSVQFVLVLFSFNFINAVIGENLCAAKSFGSNSVVCSCNATYCDEFPALGEIQNNSFIIYTSSKDGERFSKEAKSMNGAPSKPDVFIDDSTKYQTIIGFGGAITDAAALNIYRLDADTRQKLLESYYSSSGIEYTLGRIPIASTDFSTRTYSYHDAEDLSLRYFKLADEDIHYKIPVIKSAVKMSKRKIKFFSSAWSAPKWMKTNNDFIGRGFLKGSPGGPYYKAWANYLVKFLDAYKQQGIEMWGMTAQNEPVDGRIPFFPFQCMGFTADMQRDFIGTDLGPALHAAGYSDLKLMALDDSIGFLPDWAKTMYENKTTNQYVSGIGVHWYQSGYFSYSRLTDTHQISPDNKFILATEACTGSSPFDEKVILGDWDRAEQYADDIIQDLQNWVTGWTDWNIALNMSGGPNWVNNNVDSPIIVNNTEFYKQPMFYALGHFSKFLTPGSVRVDMKLSHYYINGVTFYTPENLYVMILKNSNDADENLTVKHEDNTFTVQVRGHSINTVIWKKSQ